MSEDRFVSYGRTVINWKLTNFKKDLLNSTIIPQLPSFSSPEFYISLSSYDTTKWKFIAERNKTELSLYLKMLNTPHQLSGEYFVAYEVKIKDQLYHKCIKRSQGKLSFRSVYSYEQKLGKITNLRECEKPSWYRYLYDNSIEVVVYLEVLIKLKDLSIGNTTLASHYEELFNNQKYSDFLITSTDGEEIFVHKNILSTRSPVFDAMINSEMKEGNEQKVLIPDIEGRILMELVRFIYSGKVNGIDSIASELLYAASKYDIKDLKPLCAESLALNVKLDNVLDTLILADLHQQSDLKEFCMDLIKWKYLEVKDSEVWKNFKVGLLKEVLDYVFSSRYNKNNVIVTAIRRTGNQVHADN